MQQYNGEGREAYKLIELARQTQKTSKQKSTPVGAVFRLSNGLVVYGSNEWLDYLAPERNIKTKIGSSSPSKHAEPATIACAAQQGLATDSSDLFITDPLCPNCMNAVVASGVKNIYIDAKAFEAPEDGGSEWYSRRAFHFDKTSMQIAANAGVNVFKAHLDPESETATYEKITSPPVTKNIKFLDSFDGDQIDDVYDHPDKGNSAIISKAHRKYEFAKAAGRKILDRLDWRHQAGGDHEDIEGVFGFSRIKASQFNLEEYKNEMRKFLKSHRSKNIKENGDNALAALVLPPKYGDDCYTVVLATSLSTVDKEDKLKSLMSAPEFAALSPDQQRKESKKYQAKLYPVDHLRAILGRTGIVVPEGTQLITSCTPTSHEQVGLHDIMDRFQLHILDKKASWMTKDKDALQTLREAGVSPLTPPSERVTNNWNDPPQGWHGNPQLLADRGRETLDVHVDPGGCC